MKGTSMIKIVTLVLTLILITLICGCTGAEYVGGFATGVAAMKAIAATEEAKFNESISTLQDKQKEIETLIETVDEGDAKAILQNLTKKETISTINKLVTTDWSDPKVVSGYGSAALLALTAGYQKWKRKRGE